MDLFITLLVGLGLSMDCFAVALAIGAPGRLLLVKTALITAASFGIFQAGMTVAGWIAGASLYSLVAAYGSWVAFLLLAGIGIRMICNGVVEKREVTLSGIRVLPVILLSVATSIDAFAVGVSLGITGGAVAGPALAIGLVCFAVSVTGVFCGMRLGNALGNRSEIFGGAILILIGIQILTNILPPVSTGIQVF